MNAPRQSRPPVVAGRFYPSRSEDLREVVTAYTSSFSPETAQPALAAVVPHAGYVYSGATAGETLARIRVPQSVLLLGPNHTGLGYGCALSPDDWAVPGATIPRDEALCAAILRRCSFAREDREAHSREHSLEVELPFLHTLRPDMRIACLCLGGLTLAQCRELAEGLHAALMELARPVLIVASTDMNHYESRAVGERKNRAAVDRILALDAAGLFETVRRERITMCGVLPVCVTIFLTQALGASQVELVRLTDSGEASGDTDQVVGYAGLVIA